MARVTEHGGFHCLKFFVPYVAATAGTQEFGLPESLMKFDGVHLRIAAMPFVENRDVAPRAVFEHGAQLLFVEALEQFEGRPLDAEVHVLSKPGVACRGYGLPLRRSLLPCDCPINGAADYGLVQGDNQCVGSKDIVAPRKERTQTTKSLTSSYLLPFILLIYTY